MADLRRLLDILTGFQGRINRAKWWLGLLVIGTASVLGGLILNPEFFRSELAQPSWPDTLWQIALIYPGTAITVKRFNDTGSSRRRAQCLAGVAVLGRNHRALWDIPRHADDASPGFLRAAEREWMCRGVR